MFSELAIDAISSRRWDRKWLGQSAGKHSSSEKTMLFTWHVACMHFEIDGRLIRTPSASRHGVGKVDLSKFTANQKQWLSRFLIGRYNKLFFYLDCPAWPSCAGSWSIGFRGHFRWCLRRRSDFSSSHQFLIKSKDESGHLSGIKHPSLYYDDFNHFLE